MISNSVTLPYRARYLNTESKFLDALDFQILISHFEIVIYAVLFFYIFLLLMIYAFYIIYIIILLVSKIVFKGFCLLSCELF